MAEGVDVLEPINVDVQRGDRKLRAPRSGQQLVGTIERQHPVGQAGQRVVHRQIFELAGLLTHEPLRTRPPAAKHVHQHAEQHADHAPADQQPHAVPVAEDARAGDAARHACAPAAPERDRHLSGARRRAAIAERGSVPGRVVGGGQRHPRVTAQRVGQHDARHERLAQPAHERAAAPCDRRRNDPAAIQRRLHGELCTAKVAERKIGRQPAVTRVQQRSRAEERAFVKPRPGLAGQNPPRHAGYWKAVERTHTRWHDLEITGPGRPEGGRRVFLERAQTATRNNRNHADGGELGVALVSVLKRQPAHEQRLRDSRVLRRECARAGRQSRLPLNRHAQPRCDLLGGGRQRATRSLSPSPATACAPNRDPAIPATTSTRASRPHHKAPRLILAPRPVPASLPAAPPALSTPCRDMISPSTRPSAVFTRVRGCRPNVRACAHRNDLGHAEIRWDRSSAAASRRARLVSNIAASARRINASAPSLPAGTTARPMLAPTASS